MIDLFIAPGSLSAADIRISYCPPREWRYRLLFRSTSPATFMGNPKSLINPTASFWSYSGVSSVASEGKSEKKLKPQTTCPVMGGKIDKKVFVDYEGKRVYFCCPGCIGTFKKDPAKYLKKMKEAGEEPEALKK